MAKEVKKYTAGDLVQLIRAKYSGSGFAILEQVAAGTGARANSWVDAAVFSLWPSAGIWRAACEVKVSRADFLKELSQPNKNQWAREHFDYFWYVVAPGVAKDDEIPTGCGLMAVHGSGLKIVKQAPRREKVKTDAWIIASFARSIDHERARWRGAALQEAMESNYDYKRAKLWQEGGEKFVKSCNEFCHPNTPDDVFAKLTAIAREKSPDAVAADHVLQVLGAFQDHVLHFLLDVAPLAAEVLNARDEAGAFMVSRFGSRDMKSVEQLRAALKAKRRDAWGGVDGNKRDLETRELIAEQTQ